MQNVKYKRDFRTRPEHQLLIVEECETNPILLSNSPVVKSKEEYLEKWKILTHRLNSLGFGAKSLPKWQRAVSDWISKVKCKQTKLKSRFDSMGHYDESMGVLTNLESRILAIKGLNREYHTTRRKAKNFSYAVNPLSPCNDVFSDDIETIEIKEEYDVHVNNEESEQNSEHFHFLEMENEDVEEYFNDNEPRLPEISITRVESVNQFESLNSLSEQEVRLETLKTLKTINENLVNLGSAIQELTNKLRN